MARKFGKIEGGFWQNPKIRRLSDDAQKLFLYLLTCSHSNGASAYHLPTGYVTEDLVWTPQRVTTTFHELSLKPFALRDVTANIVFIPGWWDHNQPENPKVAIFLTRQLLALPDCKLKFSAVQGLIDSGYRSAAVVDAIGDWKPSEKQEDLPLQGGQGNLLGDDTDSAKKIDAGKSKKERADGTRLYDDWQATAEMRDYAVKKGLPERRVDDEVVKFVRYWTGPDATNPVKKDWHRTWCNWIDKAAERLPVNGNGAHPPGNGSGGTRIYSTGLDDARWPMRVAEFKKSGMWVAAWGPEPGKPECKVPPELLAPV